MHVVWRNCTAEYAIMVTDSVLSDSPPVLLRITVALRRYRLLACQTRQQVAPQVGRGGAEELTPV